MNQVLYYLILSYRIVSYLIYQSVHLLVAVFAHMGINKSIILNVFEFNYESNLIKKKKMPCAKGDFTLGKHPVSALRCENVIVFLLLLFLFKKQATFLQINSATNIIGYDSNMPWRTQFKSWRIMSTHQYIINSGLFKWQFKELVTYSVARKARNWSDRRVDSVFSLH